MALKDQKAGTDSIFPCPLARSSVLQKEHKVPVLSGAVVMICPHGIAHKMATRLRQTAGSMGATILMEASPLCTHYISNVINGANGANADASGAPVVISKVRCCSRGRLGVSAFVHITLLPAALQWTDRRALTIIALSSLAVDARLLPAAAVAGRGCIHRSGGAGRGSAAADTRGPGQHAVGDTRKLSQENAHVHG